jgi:protein-S-isoprenylcysteine O-methyltransferase Ste14
MRGFLHRGGLWVAVQFAWLAAIVAIGRLDVLTFSFEGQATAGWVLIGLALVLGVWASLSLGGNLTPYPKPVEAGTMVEHGPYGVVRHPIYTAVVVGMIGISVRSGDWISLALSLGLIPFFLAKSTFEEAHLFDEYPGYEAYQQRVPRRLIPGVW